MKINSLFATFLLIHTTSCIQGQSAAQKPLVAQIEAVDKLVSYLASKQIWHKANIRHKCREVADSITVLLPNDDEFLRLQRSYYSGQQQDVKPSCRVLPKSAEELSTALRLLNEYQVPYAVKAGGHSSIANSSNIDSRGISIDLDRMKGFDFVSNKSSVVVSAGWRWGPLYQRLAGHDLAVLGGRIGDVGVAGYLLGGGLNFFGNRYGWASNMVKMYEVVLWNGTILNATVDSDLFWSLHGSNLAGIVTRFELETIANQALRIRSFQFGPAYFTEVSTALAKYAGETRMVLDTSTQSNLIATETGHIYVVSFVTSGSTEPAAITLFDHIPKISSHAGTTSLSEIANDLKEELGDRQWKATLTFLSDATMLSAIDRLVQNANNALSNTCEGSGYFFDYRQPLGDAYLESNIFGLSRADGPLIMYFLQAKWKRREDDACFEKIATATFKSIEAQARRQGLNHAFRYSNYAAGFQDIYTSYGPASRDRLASVRDKYDPGNIFEELVLSGHKLA